MSFDSIIAGDYGQDFELTFIDIDTDSAADISGYSSTIQMIFEAPDGTQTTKTATFKTDGTDGVITYTGESGFFDTAGGWKARGKVNSGSAVLTTEWSYFSILS